MKRGSSQKREKFFMLSSTLSSAAMNHLVGHGEMREKNKGDYKSERRCAEDELRQFSVHTFIY